MSIPLLMTHDLEPGDVLEHQQHDIVEFGHGSIRLGTLFNDPNEGE